MRTRKKHLLKILHILPLIVGTLATNASVQAQPLATNDAYNRQTMAKQTFYKADIKKDYKLREDDGKSWVKYKALDVDANGEVSFDEFASGADLPYLKWAGEVKRNIVYKQVGDEVLLLDVYEPIVKKYKKAPVFYYTHGGGWSGGSKEMNYSVKPLFEKLSNQGFVCVSASYRLVKMHNPKYPTVMRDCVVDCRDGLRFLKKHEQELGLDLSKVAVFGSSAGGHIAQLLTWSGADDFAGDPSLAAYKVSPTVGVSWFGPSDFRDTNLFVSEGIKDKFTPDHWSKRITKSEGPFKYQGADQKTRQMIEEVSPVYWLKKDSPPLLHMHGDQDNVISVTHAKHLEKQASNIGAPVEIIYVKGAGHGWSNKGIEPSRKTLDQHSVDYILDKVAPKK